MKEVKWIKLSELDNYNIKPKRVVEMIKSYSDLENLREFYSVDFKK